MALATTHRRLSRQLGLRLYAISSQSKQIAAAATDVTLPEDAKKYPKSAYAVFQQDPKVKSGITIEPGQGVGELSKKYGEAWKKVSDTEKAKYKAQQEKLQAEFESVNGTTGKTTKKVRGSNGKPVNGYAKYVKTHYAEIKAKLSDDTNSKQVFSEIAKVWKGLSEKEKATYKA